MSASGMLSYFSFLKHRSLVFLLQTRAGPCTDFYKSKNASVPPSVTTAHLGLLYLQPEFRLYRRECKAQVISWTSHFRRSMLQLKRKNKSYNLAVQQSAVLVLSPRGEPSRHYVVLHLPSRILLTDRSHQDYMKLN